MFKVNQTVLRNVVICVFAIGICTGVVFQTNDAYARVSLTELLARIEALEAENTGLQAQVDALEAENAAQQTQINDKQTQINGLQNQINHQQTEINDLEGTVALQDDAITDLEYTLQRVSYDGSTVLFNNVNVQIRNGSGSTSGAVNGRGNLIVGYNENWYSGDRTGSHNIVIGPNHSYFSYGGFVAGNRNTISGRYSSVSGGYDNTASGYYSSASGGKGNLAEGEGCQMGAGWYRVSDGTYDFEEKILRDVLYLLSFNIS